MNTPEIDRRENAVKKIRAYMRNIGELSCDQNAPVTHKKDGKEFKLDELDLECDGTVTFKTTYWPWNPDLPACFQLEKQEDITGTDEDLSTDVLEAIAKYLEDNEEEICRELGL